MRGAVSVHKKRGEHMNETKTRERPPVAESEGSSVISIRLTKGELDKLDRCGAAMGLSRSKVIKKWLEIIVLLDNQGS